MSTVATENAKTGSDRSLANLIPGLRFVRRLARGGFAEVWEAEQISLGRRVAVKILRHELLGQPQMVKLFEQEARVLARLNHPNVVQVIDRGTCPRGPYFVMEYIEGETLQTLLVRKRLKKERALDILLNAARGLAYAHRSRVVHRDVKPANILVGATGQVKISDFGIAAVLAAQVAQSQPKKKSAAMGTRAFMAPEQKKAFDDVDARADIYSMGVILHRIVTGRLPEVGGGATIPPEIQPIIDKSLAEDPEERYANAAAFRDALLNALGGQHIDNTHHQGAETSIDQPAGFELLDVIRQDERRSVYLVRRGGSRGDRIVVKRYRKDKHAIATIRRLAEIKHQNIIRVLGVGEREDSFIFLMEHMAGGDLRERLVKPHPWQIVARIARDVAIALARAHREGIIHGNLRPSNVMFDRNGLVKVTDFGLPEHYRGDSERRNWYAAPEAKTSIRGDLFSLGAIMYEMLMAYPVGSVEESQVLLSQESRVPADVRRTIIRLLAPVEQRFSSAKEVADELQRHLDRLDNPGIEEEVTAKTAVPAPVERQGTSRLLLFLILSGLFVVWISEQSFVQNYLIRLFSQ